MQLLRESKEVSQTRKEESAIEESRSSNLRFPGRRGGVRARL